jgi:hypothetical protein
MADVLSVAALELCNPVAFRIGVEAHDSPPHSSSGVIHSGSVASALRSSRRRSCSRGSAEKHRVITVLVEGGGCCFAR